MIIRLLSANIASNLGKEKIIVVLGAREVGKTTMFEEMKEHYKRLYG